VRTPVAFIIFNRPETTKLVFNEIVKARPRKLFVIADGPRADQPSDSGKCEAARAIIDRVDWDCQVLKNYSDVNLGCGRRPATGISWVFEQVEEAIILEDDCVPHPTFFRFCSELLENYRDDERVMQISGNNFQFGRQRTAFSYFMSRFQLCAGAWATWRRAWQYYDMEMKLWPSLRDTPWLFEILGDLRAARYWQNIFDRAYDCAGNVDYWDYQWTFAFWAQNGLSVLPSTTLVSNIGFGEDATHTKSPNDPTANLPTAPMMFPLRHPPYIARDNEADQFIIQHLLRGHQLKAQTVIRGFVEKSLSRFLRPFSRASGR